MTGEYENDIPIDDPMVVLDLVTCGWADGTERRISLWPHSDAHVEIRHFGGHYDCYTGSDRYLVTQRAVDALLAERLISGTPEWGHTNMRELIVTQRGEEKLWERISELRKQHDIEFPRASRWLHRRPW
jgi:hypothetical protein